MEQILLLPSSPRAEAAFRHALHPPLAVRVVGDLRELEGLLKKGEPEACIVDTSGLAALIPLGFLRRVHRDHPWVALVVASDFSGREMDLYRLGQLKVDGVIPMETSHPGRVICSVLDRAISAAVARRTVHALSGDLPALALEPLAWAIENAAVRPQVSELAAGLASDRRALARRMRRMGIPPPRTVLLWGRLILASHLLGRPWETVESVAFQLGYSSGGALGKAVKQHVGCSPTDLKGLGGVDAVVGILRESGFRKKEEGS